MVLNNNKQIRHHTEELMKAVQNSKHIPAWVVAKIERSATDISDATHFLEGQEMANGGMVMKRNKVADIMREFVNGELKTAQGKVVNDRLQALAIAMSEAGLSKKEMGGFLESFRIPNYNLPLDYFALKNGDMNTTTSDFE